MSDDIDLGKLSDRELLIMAVQSVNSHSKRLDAHAADIKTLRWFAAGLAGALGLMKLPAVLGGGH